MDRDKVRRALFQFAGFNTIPHSRLRQYLSDIEIRELLDKDYIRFSEKATKGSHRGEDRYTITNKGCEYRQ